MDPNVRPTLTRGQSGISLGAYSRKDGDDLTQAVYSLAAPLCLTFLASTLQAAGSIDACVAFGDCTGLRGYSVALGVVSASVLLIFFIAFAVEFSRERLPEKSLLFLAGGILLWWIAGVAVTTFQVTVNGDTRYFASWASLIFAAMVAHSEFDQFAQLVSDVKALERHSQATFYLFLASIVETAAAVFPCVDISCTGIEIYGILVGAISLILCIILLRVGQDRLGFIGHIFAVFLVVWWTVALGVLTLGAGPFKIASNGFFACWAGFLLSFFVTQAMMFPQSENYGGNGRQIGTNVEYA
jgi:hypothetical protein